MLHKTRGIFFKSTSYSDTSVIAKVLTEKFGLQSYIIQGVKKPKARIRNNILQPLHLLDMVVYHKPFADLQRVSEVRNLPVFQTIPYDIIKSSLVLFINEVMYKAIRQEETDESMFNFIFHSLEVLDQTENGLALFHLNFLLRLTRYLGFYPEAPHTVSDYFDLREGTFTNSIPGHSSVLHPPHTAQWVQLLQADFNTLENLKIGAKDRRFILDRILEYYRLHVEGFDQIKSHYILEEVLN